ncbi:MAG: hypothetical protein K2K82_02440 [Muribaculaceae bacterium]|nr:hypothetical protein [Muribaculaceae bacterium]
MNIKITEQQARQFPEHFRKVHHMEESTDNSKIWIDFWEKSTGRTIPSEGFKCPSCSETMTEIVGGHVIDDETGEKFITPVCLSCNSKFKNSMASEHHFYVRVCDLVKPS